MPALYASPTAVSILSILSVPHRASRAALILASCVIQLILFCIPAVIAHSQPVAPPSTKAKAVAGAYTIDDIGPLATIAADVTVSLSRDGAVAYWTRTDGAVHAALWRNGHTIVLENLPGYPNSIAHAINRSGDIAGWMNTSGNLVDSSSTTHGFVRHREHIEIVPGLGGRDSRVFGLNDKGTAVGGAMTAEGTRHAFVFSRFDITDLGTLPSGRSSAAYAINTHGVVTGVADVDGKANHAVLWSHGKIIDLGTLAHGATSGSRAINDRWQIAGFSDSADGVHAFLYSRGVMQDLGTLGKDPSEASGLNNRGEVVGASNISGTRRHAFIWRHGRMMDLNDYLPVGSQWVLLNAFTINDRGQITCSATSATEGLHLFLLTPQRKNKK